MVYLFLFGRSSIDKFTERHTSHEELAVVSHHGKWSLGEYRECVSINLKTEGKELPLDCRDDSDLLSPGVAKVFNVTFSGDLTYDDERPENVIHRWLCRRNGGDPTFSCSAEATPVERQLTDAEIENLCKRNECEQRFYDKKISGVNGMSIGRACTANPDRMP